MSDIFLLMTGLLSGIALVLYFFPYRQLLNFVDYGSPQATPRINRYAARRLLLPVAIHALCVPIAALRPELGVPLLFLTPLSILAAVVWIAAGVHRLNTFPAT
ncbi:hypothetical protein [Massilia sp. Leaf139]|uniref:hypothetical protein n=1 Tax=Massilia sp. Leaf139 TaxID=1736272 RepID=UPI0006FB4132|nr:hypothetical protein [Massilia sp. Leaf139]KQQ96469.1 hypothetical protein ASF77_00215 [Massilia sp. Leaf139]